MHCLLVGLCPRVFGQTPSLMSCMLYRMPSRVVEFRTPLQVLTEHVPVVSTNTLTPRVFGCVAYVHIHKIHHSKLDPCAFWCVFVGFASHQKGYKCYHPATCHMYITMDVTFSESEYFYALVSPPFDHKGESSSCDLDGDFEWLDVQEVTISGGVHSVVLNDAVDARPPPAEPVVSGQSFSPNLLQVVSSFSAKKKLPVRMLVLPKRNALMVSQLLPKLPLLSLAQQCHCLIHLLWISLR